MARNKLPQDLAKVTGATGKNPGRYSASTVRKAEPLGSAPDNLTATERGAWNEIASEMPWLAKSDRMITAIAARLTARIREPDCPIGIYTQLRLCLTSMGGTPTNRPAVPDDGEDDPADRFFQ